VFKTFAQPRCRDSSRFFATALPRQFKTFAQSERATGLQNFRFNNHHSVKRLFMNNHNKMFIKMITASILRRRSRMIIALLAIVVGATILSGLVTIYYDVPRQMGAQFRNYGANMIFTAGDQDIPLTDDAVKKASSYIPADELVGVTPYRFVSVRINEQPVIAAGTDIAGTEKTSPYWFINGARPVGAMQVLVGKKIAELLGIRVNSTIEVHYYDPNDQTNQTDIDLGENMIVTGILETGSTEEQYIYMSLADLAVITGSDGSYDVVELSVSSSEDKLNRYVSIIEASDAGVKPRLVTRVTSSEGAVLTKLQSLVFIVTAVVLVLTMICVATTMTAVISERRKEIGLRKALGASDASIIKEFMAEGLVLGAIGGILGAALGFVFAEIVSINVFSSSITFLPLLAIATVAASVLVTGLACLIPIRTATDIDPALILKGE